MIELFGELKKITEAETPFKPAEPEEVAARKKFVDPAWFSIRVVRAKDRHEAIKKVENGDFEEDHPACDIVVAGRKVLISGERYDEAKSPFKPASKKEVAARKMLGAPTKERQQEILNLVSDSLSYQFDNYSWSDMIRDTPELTQAEKEWATENISYQAYIVA